MKQRSKYWRCLLSCCLVIMTATASAQQPPPRAAKTATGIDEALHHYNLGIIWEKTEPEEAVREFKKALEYNPNLAYAYYELAEIYAARNHWDLAVNNYLKAYELDNKLYSGLLKIAQMQHAAKAYDKALRLCEQVLAQYPKDEQALKLKERIIEFQEMPGILLAEGEKNLQKENFAEALAAFNKILIYDDTSAAAYRGLGETYRRMKDFAQAEKCFQQSLALNPNSSPTHSGLGWLALDREDEEAAAKYFREALVLDNGNLDAFNGLKSALGAMTDKMPERFHQQGEQYLAAGKYPEAREQFERSLIINQKYYPSLVGLADLDVAEGDILRAEEKYTAALMIAPTNVDILMKLANLYIKENNPQKAIKIFVEALKIKPDLPVALTGKAAEEKKLDTAAEFYRIGSTLLRYEANVEAREEFSKALRINPTYKEAFLGMATAFRQANDYVSARSYYQKALEVDSRYFPALSGMAEVEYQLHNYQQAALYLNRAELVEPAAAANQEIRYLLQVIAEDGISVEYDKMAGKSEITNADWAVLLILNLRAKQLIAPRETDMPVITDVDQTWAKEYIMDAVYLDLLNVYDDHTFRPEKMVSRQELARYVLDYLIALGTPGFSPLKFEGSSSPLTDVASENVYFNAILAMTTSGIIPVDENGKFNPETNVSGREVMSVIRQLKTLEPLATTDKKKSLN